MACPDCASTATTRRKGRTALGYRRFCCQACRRRFNERTGTPFNDLQYPTDIVLLAVLWRLRYKLGFGDVAELLLQRGFEVTHETIRAWEVRFAPLLADQMRAKRRGQAGGSWYLDETYVKVAGRWCYRYRAIDREGVLLDSMLSEHRDKHAARRFLRRLVEVTERKPQRVTTDQHPAAVRHRRTRPYRPQTNGKVERFNRTLLEEWAYVRVYRSEAARTAALARWLHLYNHHRCHTALSGHPPIGRVTNLPVDRT